jgi:hypothetical protein
MIIGSFNRQHQRWYGLKSIEQYQREEHSESINFFAEGASELRRLLKREPPLQVYSESSHKHFIPQLEPVTDSLVWKDQAKELVRLSSSSYAFDTDSGWHDKENCWVGQNVNTGDLVFLYPYQGEISEDEFKMFLEYTKRIAKSENKGIGEIIAASKRETFKPIELWEGLFIRYETETSLLDCLVDFKDYFNEIRRRVLVNYLPDSNLTLLDVYVLSFFSRMERSITTQLKIT